MLFRRRETGASLLLGGARARAFVDKFPASPLAEDVLNNLASAYIVDDEDAERLRETVRVFLNLGSSQPANPMPTSAPYISQQVDQVLKTMIARDPAFVVDAVSRLGLHEFVDMVSALGASATPMPYGEVYTGLKTGLIDAAENNIPSFDTAKHVEAVKVYSKTEHSMAPEMLLSMLVAPTLRKVAYSLMFESPTMTWRRR